MQGEAHSSGQSAPQGNIFLIFYFNDLTNLQRI